MGIAGEAESEREKEEEEEESKVDGGAGGEVGVSGSGLAGRPPDRHQLYY